MSIEPGASSTAGTHEAPAAGPLALVGLGRMGANMGRRLARAGVVVHGVDADDAARAALQGTPGVTVHAGLEAALAALDAPRTVWLMLPAGAATQAVIDELLERLAPGDLVIDGGNADHRDSRRRAEVLAAHGIGFADCGVSGGVWGLDNGYCLMFGADATAAPRVSALARVLAPAPDRGWLHCGAPGSGHFVKMIHNGIEYGAMQAYAEGFALQGVRPFVADSGEGRWTVEEAIRQGTPAPVIALALMTRFDSQGRADTANRLLALMRKGFGGHPVKTK